jgi:hypothetical protein
MHFDLVDAVRFVFDREIEAPRTGDARLPYIAGHAVFLRMQRRMATVCQKQRRLLVKCSLDRPRRCV